MALVTEPVIVYYNTCDQEMIQTQKRNLVINFQGVVYIMMKDFFNGLVSARMMELDSSRSFAKARKAERTAK